MPLFPLLDHLEPSGAPPPLLGAVWETAGRGLGDGWGDGWETAGRGLEGVWETCGSRLGEVCGTSGRRLGAHRWPELETTARPGEESRGGGGAGWGSRRCGSGQPAVPAGGISPLSRVGASARQGRRSFRFTPISAGGLLVHHRLRSNPHPFGFRPQIPDPRNGAKTSCFC